MEPAKIKAVLFNGPPYCGKDTAAEWLNECVSRRYDTLEMHPLIMKMAESLKLATHALFGEEHLPAHAFEGCKDKPHPVFLGNTPRQCYIDLAEKFGKPIYGKDFFAKVFVNRMKRRVQDELYGTHYDALVICSDLGFSAEAQVVIDAIGKENVLIVHIKRDGTDFSNDSRGYIHAYGVQTITLNNRNITAFRMEVFERVRCWLETGSPLREEIVA